MKFKEFDLEPADECGGIRAYAATFDRERDCYGDVIKAGAFAKTLEEWEASGMPIPLLFGHNMNDPEYNIGTVTSAVEDEKGLLIEATFDEENPKAQYVRKLVNEHRVSKMSFAFDILEEGKVTLEDGQKANELRELRIYECSIVTVPANGHAVILESKSVNAGEDEPVDIEPEEPATEEEEGKANTEPVEEPAEPDPKVTALLDAIENLYR